MSIEENSTKLFCQRRFCKLTGDTKTQAEGAAEKVASKAKEMLKMLKRSCREGAVSGVKNILKRRRIILLVLI